MRFITQFEISPDEYHRMSEEHRERRIEWLKKQQATDIGRLIGEEFGFEKQKYHELRWGMEFQAFKMEEWDNFKEQLREWLLTMNSLGMNNLSEIFLEKLFTQLEEKGLLKEENSNL